MNKEHIISKREVGYQNTSYTILLYSTSKKETEIKEIVPGTGDKSMCLNLV